MNRVFLAAKNELTDLVDTALKRTAPLQQGQGLLVLRSYDFYLEPKKNAEPKTAKRNLCFLFSQTTPSYIRVDFAQAAQRGFGIDELDLINELDWQCRSIHDTAWNQDGIGSSLSDVDDEVSDFLLEGTRKKGSDIDVLENSVPMFNRFGNILPVDFQFEGRSLAGEFLVKREELYRSKPVFSSLDGPNVFQPRPSAME